jgi:hypothetical protein
MFNGGAIGLVCCGAVFGLLIALIIGAVIVRCSCWIYNKMVGATAPRKGRYQEDEEEYDDRRTARELDNERDEDEEQDADDRPRIRRRPTIYDGDGPGVPEPSTGRAMGIAALILVLTIVIGQVISFTTGVGARGFAAGGAATKVGLLVIAGCGQLVVDYLIVAGLLTAMLPTKFGRACVVALICCVIYIIIAVIAVLIIVVLVQVGRGGW